MLKSIETVLVSGAAIKPLVLSIASGWLLVTLTELFVFPIKLPPFNFNLLAIVMAEPKVISAPSIVRLGIALANKVPGKVKAETFENLTSASVDLKSITPVTLVIEFPEKLK